MKNSIHILLSLSFLMLLAACKNPAIDYDDFTVTELNVQPNSREAVVTGSYRFLGEVSMMELRIKPDESQTNYESHPVKIDHQNFSVEVENLSPGTDYRFEIRVAFIDDQYRSIADLMGHFTTLSEKPQVRTLDVTQVDPTTFQVRCTVDADGGMDITERGVCWNQVGAPHLGDSHLAHQENGLGEYTCTIRDLAINSTYYVRAYAKNGIDVAYAEEILSINTDNFKVPDVTTAIPTDITLNSAICGGTIDYEGSSPVTQYGVCWSTEDNPNIDGPHTSNNANETTFSETIADLMPSTTYYVCAYAINDVGTGYGDILSFTTLSFTPNRYNVEVECNPSAGGTASGGGEYDEGSICTVKVDHVNEHYEFINWTENQSEVSSDVEYTFTVTRDRNLTANFKQKTYTISATANPSSGGSVSGTGNHFTYGTDCTLTATANVGYEFERWTENDNEVSNEPNYTFTVNGNRDLVAHFVPHVPQGGVDGMFSVSATQQVYFSQGNLQYTKSTREWSFMEHQYDIVETNGQDVGENYANQNVVSLFGWGTGNNPTKTSQSSQDYQEFTDWGTNRISNADNVDWRTLTKTEWKYVFNEREASTINNTPNARYVKAMIGDIKGVILFPDEYTHPNNISVPQQINQPTADFAYNKYTINNLSQMQGCGCVFLPLAGLRRGTIVNDLDQGYYWSSSADVPTGKVVRFNSTTCNPEFGISVHCGASVRLVHPIQ